MKFIFIEHKLYQTEYLANMQNGDELRRACKMAIEQAESVEQLLQVRVEMILITMRLRGLPTDPYIYSFMPLLLGDLQLKMNKVKLK